MKAIRVFQCGVLCAGTLLFTAQGSLAQDVQKSGEPEKIRIGDQEYTRGEIIADFLNIAVSDQMWNQELDRLPSGFSRAIDRYISEKVVAAHKVGGPWFAPYLDRQDGWPTRGSLNKWQRNSVTVGIGWPRYSLSPTAKDGHIYAQSEEIKFYPKVQKKIEGLIPILENHSGINISFIPPTDRKENSEDYAVIRIIPFKSVKSGRRSPFAHEGLTWYPHFAENDLWGGVLFESSDDEMDGYLLPKGNNELGFVVCKINIPIDDEPLESAITECLIRAMGLPGLSSSRNTSLGGVHSIKKDSGHITPYDAYMVKLLNCPSLKSGMDKNQIFQVLTKKNCIDN